MPLSQADLVTLASSALAVVQARAAQSTPIGDRLAAELQMCTLQEQLRPTPQELRDVLRGVALYHRQQAAEAEAWAEEACA